MNAKEIERLVAGSEARVAQDRSRKATAKKLAREEQATVTRRWMRVKNPAAAKAEEDEINTRRQLREWFDFLDKDGSGDIDIVELEDPLTCMGLTHSKEEVQRLVAAIDEDANGEIGFDEFTKVVTSETKDAFQPMKAMFALFQEGKIGDASISLHVIIAAYRRFTVRLDSEEKEKLRGRLEGAYKKRIAARVDGEGGAPGGGGLTGRTRTGSNLSKYIFDEKSASARVVDVSSVTGNERRTLRGAARKVAAISRRDEMRRLRTVTRGADYDAFRSRASHKAAAEVISSGLPTHILSRDSPLPAVASPGTNAAVDRAMYRSAQLAVASAAMPLNAALGANVTVNHDAEVREIMRSVRTASPSLPRRLDRSRAGARTAPLGPIDGTSTRHERAGPAGAEVEAELDAGPATATAGGVGSSRWVGAPAWMPASAAAAEQRCASPPPDPAAATGGSLRNSRRGGVTVRMSATVPTAVGDRVPFLRQVLSPAQEAQQASHFRMLRLRGVDPAGDFGGPGARDAPAWHKANVGRAYGNWGYVAGPG